MISYGSVRFSFGDPKSPYWAAVVLGVCLALAGAIIVLVLALSDSRNTDLHNLDAVVGLLFVAAILLGGAALVAYGGYNLAFPAEWHLTATHVYRARGSNEVRVLDLRTLPTPLLRQQMRYGQIISVWVCFGSTILVAPSLEVARAVHAAWKAQQR